MPKSAAHGWPRATSLALLLPLVLPLPSCMTTLLWNAHEHSRTQHAAPTTAARAMLDTPGAHALAVQVADDLGRDSTGSFGFVGTGEWLACDFDAPSPAIAELLRLRAAGITSDTTAELYLHGIENALVNMTAHIDNARLGDVRLTPGLVVTPHGNQPNDLIAHADGKLRRLEGRAPGGELVPGVRITWTENTDEPFSVPAKIALTPVTAVMDVALGPVALLGAGYLLMYSWFGGRG